MGIKIKRKNKQKNHKNIILLYIYYFLGKIETCFSVINLHIWTYISTHPHLSTASHTHSIADCLNPWICFVLANWEQSELKALQWINTAVIRADLFLWPCEREDYGYEKSEGQWEKAQTQKTVVQLWEMCTFCR